MIPHFKKALFALPFFLIVIVPANSQTWRNSYEQASKLFQSGNYAESLAGAEAILENNQIENSSDKAYLLQLITSNCFALNTPDEGIKYSGEEIGLFRQVEGTKSKSLAEAMRKEIYFLQQKEMEKQALPKCEEAEKCFSQSYGNNSLSYARFSLLYGEIALAAADSVLALTKWNDCLSTLSSFPEASEEYKTLLFNTAALQESLHQFSAAQEKYGLLVNWLEKTKQTTDENYNDAKEAIKRLQSKTNTNGAPQLSTLEAQLKNAVSLQQNHKNEQALEVYKSAQAAALTAGIKNKTSFSIYLNYARLLLDTGNPSAATQPLNNARSIGKSLFSASSFENILVDLTEADLQRKLGDYSNATVSYRTLSRKLNKDSLQKLNPYLIQSANELLNQNMPAMASQLLKPALSQTNQSEKMDVQFILIALTYADALLAMNQPDSALLFLNQIIHGNNQEVELKKIEALNLSGDYTTSLKKLKEMEAAASSDQSKAAIAYQIARTSQKAGLYVEAENYYQLAFSLYAHYDKETAWQVSNSQATLYSKLGNYDKSEKMLNELLKSIPQNNSLYLTIQQNLASNYVETNQLEKAKSIQENIVINEKMKVGETHPDYALAISNLGVLYKKEGRLKEAVSLFQQALKISKINFGDLSTDYAMKEINLGIAFNDLGDYAQSALLLEHAQKILAERIGRTHSDFIVCEYNLAIVYKRIGKLDLATPLMEHVSEFYKHEVLELFPAMNEHEQVAFYNKINRPIQDFQQFAVEIGPQKPELISHLLDFRLTTKALLLNSSTKIRKGILSGDNQKLKEEFLLWQNLKIELGKLYSSGQVGEKRVSELESQTDDLEKKLSLGSSTFKSSLDEKEVTWKKIQNVLKPGEAAIELIRLRAIGKKDSLSYAALVIRKEYEYPKLVVFSKGKMMEGREFNFYHNNIIHQQLNDRSYQVFWQPLEAVLGDIQTIYVSADGIYNKINLSTLYDPEKQEYLTNRYRFILLSNLREIIAEDTGPKESVKSAALFGFPDFGAGRSTNLRSTTSSLQSILSEKIPSLPGTKVEVELIDKIIKGATWVSNLETGSQASEANLKLLQSPSVVHLATHGFFVQFPSEEEQVVLTENKEIENNPLLRSGLILSDVANPAGSEDGLLTAYEVKNLNFDNTDLVVLSACETGSGEIKNGEGVYGLQRSFLLSGASTILMSLWKVDDQATQELMVLFYQKLIAQTNKVEALHDAQTELMKKYPNPFFWGSFVLIGKQNKL